MKNVKHHMYNHDWPQISNQVRERVQQKIWHQVQEPCWEQILEQVQQRIFLTLKIKG